MGGIEPFEVDITLVDAVDAVRYNAGKLLGGFHIMHLPVTDVSEDRNVPVVIKLAVQFNRAFLLTELCPVENAQAQRRAASSRISRSKVV